MPLAARAIDLSGAPLSQSVRDVPHLFLARFSLSGTGCPAPLAIFPERVSVEFLGHYLLALGQPTLEDKCGHVCGLGDCLAPGAPFWPAADVRPLAHGVPRLVPRAGGTENAGDPRGAPTTPQ